MNRTIITLLSDLGAGNTSVSAARAALIGCGSEVQLIDMSHNVAPFDLRQAAYILLSAWRHFPKGSVHVVMVDVLGGHMPRMLLIEMEDHYFIVPDNGIITLAFGEVSFAARLCYEFSRSVFFSEWVDKAATVLKCILQGDTDQYTHFNSHTQPVLTEPVVHQDSIECSILSLDRYENVILDITREQFNRLINSRPFRIRTMKLGDITTLSQNYNDVDEGKALCRFNIAGYLEIAVYHGRAASILGIKSDTSGKLNYRTIKIFV